MSTIESIFRLELAATWRIGCVIIAFMALRLALRATVSARRLYSVWVAVALLLIVPISVPARWSPFNLLSEPRKERAAVGIRDAVAARPTPPVPSRSMDPGVLARVSPLAPAHISISGFEAMSLAWCAGVAALLAYRVTAYLRFSRKLRSLPDGMGGIRDCLPQDDLAGLAANRARVVVTDAVRAPALHGVIRPWLLFPPGLIERLSREEISLIVTHELCHHRRRDILSQTLIQGAQAVHWFNPVVWIAGRLARNDCELACDEHVVEGLGQVGPEAYGATLLKILSLSSRTPSTPVGIGILESKKQIKRRIQMIVADKPRSLARALLGWSLLIAVGTFGITRESLAQTPAAPAAPSTPTSAATPGVIDKVPKGWWKNGESKENYAVGIDEAQAHEGMPSAFVRSLKDGPGFGGMMQMCQPDAFVGKRIRYSAWMKTQDITGHGAHLWFRVDGQNKMVQFDNMDGREVYGTTDWKLYSIVLDVPADSKALAFGFFLSGVGEAWVSGVKIEEVGMDVKSTAIEEKPNLPASPVNLGFALSP